MWNYHENVMMRLLPHRRFWTRIHLYGLMALGGVATPGIAPAVVVVGAEAQSFFDYTVANHGDTLIDFTGMAGTLLDTELSGQGVTFYTVENYAGNPIGPHNVRVSNMSGRVDSIVGTPCAGCGDDGRYPYEIYFDAAMPRAGLLRTWSNTYTEFYNSSGVLLGQHLSTGTEFVGWNSDSADTSTWVKKIKIDGIWDEGTQRAVGYSDNLTFGSVMVAIPEGKWAGWALGLVAFGWVLTRRRTPAR